MIRLLTIPILILFLISCGSQSAKMNPTIPIKDTTKTLALFLDADSLVKFDYVFREVKDTFRVVQLGSKLSVTAVRDSIYHYPNWLPLVDTAGKKLLKADGTDSLGLFYAPGKQKLMEDFNIDMDRVDSILRAMNTKRLSQMINRKAVVQKN